MLVYFLVTPALSYYLLEYFLLDRIESQLLEGSLLSRLGATRFEDLVMEGGVQKEMLCFWPVVDVLLFSVLLAAAVGVVGRVSRGSRADPRSRGAPSEGVGSSGKLSKHGSLIFHDECTQRGVFALFSFLEPAAHSLAQQKYALIPMIGLIGLLAGGLLALGAAVQVVGIRFAAFFLYFLGCCSARFAPHAQGINFGSDTSGNLSPSLARQWRGLRILGVIMFLGLYISLLGHSIAGGVHGGQFMMPGEASRHLRKHAGDDGWSGIPDGWTGDGGERDFDEEIDEEIGPMARTAKQDLGEAETEVRSFYTSSCIQYLLVLDQNYRFVEETSSWRLVRYIM